MCIMSSHLKNDFTNSSKKSVENSTLFFKGFPKIVQLF